MAEFTPTTEQIRTFWASEVALPAAKSSDYDESVAEFDRWLAAYTRQVSEKSATEALARVQSLRGGDIEQEYIDAALSPYREGRVDE